LIWVSLSGLLSGLAYPGKPWNQFAFFAWFSLVPLLIVLIKTHSFKQSLLYIIVYFEIFTLIVGWWISLISPWGFIGTLATQLTITAIPPFFLFLYLNREMGWFYALISFPFILCGWEWAAQKIEFSWGNIVFGNTQANYIYFNQIADITGVWGISFWLFLLNTIITMIILHSFKTKSSRKILFSSLLSVSGLLLIFCIPLGYSYYCLSNQDRYLKNDNAVNVSIIQPCIDPNKKWENRAETTLKTAVEMTDSFLFNSKDQTDLIVWPEAVIAYYLYNTPEIRDYIFSYIHKWNLPLLTGVLDVISIYPSSSYTKKTETIPPKYLSYYNAVTMISPQLVYAYEIQKINLKEVKFYYKQTLIPFFEYIPYIKILGFLSELMIEQGSKIQYSKGRSPEIFAFAAQNLKTYHVGSILCSDQFYPSLSAEIVNLNTDFMVLQANEGWFGYSQGTYQLSAITRLRAIEARRSFVRSSMTGLSFFIDPLGRIYGELPWWKPGWITSPVAIGHYSSFYCSHIDYLPKTCLVIVLILLGTVTLKKYIITKSYSL